jgi:hypothetical protein
MKGFCVVNNAVSIPFKGGKENINISIPFILNNIYDLSLNKAMGKN